MGGISQGIRELDHPSSHGRAEESLPADEQHLDQVSNEDIYRNDTSGATAS